MNICTNVHDCPTSSCWNILVFQYFHIYQTLPYTGLQNKYTVVWTKNDEFCLSDTYNLISNAQPQRFLSTPDHRIIWQTSQSRSPCWSWCIRWNFKQLGSAVCQFFRWKSIYAHNTVRLAWTQEQLWSLITPIRPLILRSKSMLARSFVKVHRKKVKKLKRQAGVLSSYENGK